MIGADSYRGPQTGLRICGVCGQPVETIKIVLGREYRPHVRCRCDQLAADTLAREMATRDSMAKARYLAASKLQSGALEINRGEVDLGYNAEYMSRIKTYSANWEEENATGVGLLFFGRIGTGKTFLATHLGNELIDKGVPVLMIDCCGLDKQFYGIDLGDQSAVLESIDGYGLLILDYIDAAIDNKNAVDYLEHIVNRRGKIKKPMVVTTTLTPKVMRQLPGKQGRVCGLILERCEPLWVEGENIRQIKAKKLIAEAKKEKLKLANAVFDKISVNSLETRG